MVDAMMMMQLPKREPSEKDVEFEKIAEQVEGTFNQGGGGGAMDLDEQPPILTNEDKRHQVDRQLSSQGLVEFDICLSITSQLSKQNFEVKANIESV